MGTQSLVSGMDHHQGAKGSCPSWPDSPFHKSQGGSPARNPSPRLSPSMDSHGEMQFPAAWSLSPVLTWVNYNKHSLKHIMEREWQVFHPN